MFHKIKIIRLIIFVFLFVIMFVISLNLKGNVETNLLKTFLPQSIIDSANIVPIADKSSSLIKVVFESDDENVVSDLKEKFIKQIDSSSFVLNKPDLSLLLDKYLLTPTNFISDNTRFLLKQKKYNEVYVQAMERLYNPTGIQISSLDKDPYLLLDEFLLSKQKKTTEIFEENGKYYDYTSIKINKNDGLSPDLCNKKIEELISLQKQLSTANSKIYLSGTPIHSYYTSKKSAADINIICLLSVLMIFLLTYLYFRSIKPVFPIMLSIMSGMLVGYIATRLWFQNFQILTTVFSTTLIGIGIDYSFHYFFTENKNGIFMKKLTYSLLTSLIPFILLYITGIELLKQISVFTVFGLITIYSVVLFLYPCFTINMPTRTIIPKQKMYNFILVIVITVALFGYINFRFNDSLTSMYSPSKDLKQAEAIYNKVSGENNVKTQFITVEGKNLKSIIKREEKVTEKLYRDNIDFIAISSFLPSIKKQKENYMLVKELYNANMNNYSGILSENQIKKLSNADFSSVTFNLKAYDFLSDLLLNKNTSIIIAYTDKPLKFKSNKINVINLKTDVEKYLKSYRNTLLKIFPIVIFSLFIILSIFCGYKNSIKVILPSLIGIIASAGIANLLIGEINLFSIIAMFMVLGFTMDYSIFRLNKERKTEDAILVSSLTTMFSFLLLSFCGFKLLTSISLILFIGIFTAYISGYIIFSNSER